MVRRCQEVDEWNEISLIQVCPFDDNLASLPVQEKSKVSLRIKHYKNMSKHVLTVCVLFTQTHVSCHQWPSESRLIRVL